MRPPLAASTNASRAVASSSSARVRGSMPDSRARSVTASNTPRGIVVGDRLQHRNPTLEAGAAEGRDHAVGVEVFLSAPCSTPTASAMSSFDIASRAGTCALTHDDLDRLGVGLDAFAPGMSARWSRSSSCESSVNSKCWVRDRIVGSTFCGSVVASTNTTCARRLLERLQQRVRRRRARACAPRR